MESNRTTPTSSNTSTTSTTPTTSETLSQEVNTRVNQMALLPPPSIRVPSLFSSPNQPFSPPQPQHFPTPSYPYQGPHCSPSAHQSAYPQVFPPEYHGTPFFPVMPDQNRIDHALPMHPFMGGIHHEGVLPTNQVGGSFGRIEESSRILPTLHQSLKWDSSDSKAARSKRKMAMQMSSSSSATKPSPSSSSSRSVSRTPLPTTANRTNDDKYVFSAPDGKKLKFILEKELKNTDVGSLGRIVLPKKPSEENLPNLSAKEGIQIAFREVESSTIWHMRYRFWPNNKSRMYILENTGKYITQNKLKVGDYIMIYKDEENQLYISFKKAETSSSKPVNNEAGREVGTSQQHGPSLETDIDMFGHNLSSNLAADDNWNQQALGLDDPSFGDMMINESETLPLDDSYFKDDEHLAYNMSDLQRLPNFDECDFSIYDDDQLMEDNHGDDGEDDDNNGGGDDGGAN